MPTYEYECTSCGHKFEQFQSIVDKALTKCPKCHKSKLRRLIGTGGAVMFKGSGFYETDYKRAGSKKSPCETCEGKKECPSAKSDGAKSSD
jgi:putative FmdB family regulatory protein